MYDSYINTSYAHARIQNYDQWETQSQKVASIPSICTPVVAAGQEQPATCPERVGGYSTQCSKLEVFTSFVMHTSARLPGVAFSSECSWTLRTISQMKPPSSMKNCSTMQRANAGRAYLREFGPAHRDSIVAHVCSISIAAAESAGSCSCDAGRPKCRGAGSM